jgi:hypothetical protein
MEVRVFHLFVHMLGYQTGLDQLQAFNVLEIRLDDNPERIVANLAPDFRGTFNSLLTIMTHVPDRSDTPSSIPTYDNTVSPESGSKRKRDSPHTPKPSKRLKTDMQTSERPVSASSDTSATSSLPSHTSDMDSESEESTDDDPAPPVPATTPLTNETEKPEFYAQTLGMNFMKEIRTLLVPDFTTIPWVRSISKPKIGDFS